MIKNILTKLDFNMNTGEFPPLAQLQSKEPTEEEKLSAQIRDKVLAAFEKYPPHEWVMEDCHFKHPSTDIKLYELSNLLYPIGLHTTVSFYDKTKMYSIFYDERENYYKSQEIEKAKLFLQQEF